jgi:hypothetical protein
MKKFFQKIKKWYVAMPDKKKHVELITAALSVPMMVTVILVNFNSIKTQKEKANTTQITPIQVVIDNPNVATSSSPLLPPPKDKVSVTPTTAPTSTPAPTNFQCKKTIGPIEILSPQEGEIITDNNVCINISTDANYCPVVWSYRLGTDNWSEFNNKDICLYNLTPGKKKLQIKIKSTVSDNTITLERNFIYQSSGDLTVTPTTTITPTVTP